MNFSDTKGGSKLFLACDQTRGENFIVINV